MLEGLMRMSFAVEGQGIAGRAAAVRSQVLPRPKPYGRNRPGEDDGHSLTKLLELLVLVTA